MFKLSSSVVLTSHLDHSQPCVRSLLFTSLTPYEEISVSYLCWCPRDSALVLAHTFGRSCLGAHLPSAQDAQHLRLLLREFKTINILLPHFRREREREIFTQKKSTHTAELEKNWYIHCSVGYEVCVCVQRKKKLLFSWKRRRRTHHFFLLTHPRENK